MTRSGVGGRWVAVVDRICMGGAMGSPLSSSSHLVLYWGVDEKEWTRGVDLPHQLAGGPCCVSSSVFLGMIGSHFLKKSEWVRVW